MSSQQVQPPRANQTTRGAAAGSRPDDDGPSITVSVFGYWIVPVIFIALLSRFAVDTSMLVPPVGNKGDSALPFPPTRPIVDPVNAGGGSTQQKSSSEPKKNVPPFLANKPASYQEAVQAIGRRRLDSESTPTTPLEGRNTHQKPKPTETNNAAKTSQTTAKPEKETTSPTSPQTRGASTDPVRQKFLARIDEFRQEYHRDRSDIFKAAYLADALRMYDVQYHDGGTAQEEALETYRRAIEMALEKRQGQIERGEETNRSLSGTVEVNEEMTLEYSAKSTDGLLCALYTNQGKTFFMANMFEKAVESYSKAMELEPLYLDAVSSRGGSRIILGEYEGAANDFLTVMKWDDSRRFQDIYTGLARILQAKESAVPGGWEPVVESLNEMIPRLENQFENVDIPEAKQAIAGTLNRFYHVLFLYNDVKTNDVDAAFDYLTRSYRYKMSVLPPWNSGFESQKIASTKQIFHRGFWPAGVGSKSQVPIFIIGFVRSGSTLLERVLDAHPQIVGTGENSVFNGQLDNIRNKIVETSMASDYGKLYSVIESLADGVVEEMQNRWDMVSSGENRSDGDSKPLRFVDKMLTNYYNVGFIHMLFPNALILHVAREPMDTIFSAYKHEFPSGPLDYTSDFEGLAELYHAYRDLIDHWDKELPGRVTHVRYEDMVNDMPGVARKIIEATGLDWDDSVLDFHKKKQAVNTLSTTQVRKGVYKDSLQSWRRYESHLKALVDKVGERTKYNLKTTLNGYRPPPAEDHPENPEL